MSIKMSIKLVSAALCLLILFVPLVSADETTEAFTVYTDKQEYIVGEAVNVYVKAEVIDPNQTITITDVIVYDPNNSSVAEWQNLSIVLTNVVTPEYVGTVIATSEGEYTVSAKATGCPFILWALWHFFCRWWQRNTIPEYPFGTIAAMAAFFGATGLYVSRKKHRVKK
jgi:type 1 fimbria pilin